MNKKKACAVRRKPFSRLRRLSGLRFGGSGIHQRRLPAKNGWYFSSARRRSKKGKTIALSAAGTKYAPALLSYICTAEKRVIVAGLPNIRPNTAAPEGFCAFLYQTLCKKKPVKGRRAKAVESPIVCALHPRDAAAFFPCHSGAFLLCPFFLGHQRHSAGLRLRRNASAVFV